MCGRYLRRSDKQRIAEAFRLLEDLSALVLPPDYNVAPSTMQPVIRLNRDTGQRELVLMRWGLIPSFAKSPADYKTLFTINARSETVATNPLWRRPFERHRCLVPADAFYEWQKPAAPKATLPAQAAADAPNPPAVAARTRKPKPARRQPWIFTVTPETSPLPAPKPVFLSEAAQAAQPKHPERSQPAQTPSSLPTPPFAFAGLWDAWRDPANGIWLQTFAILTTDANQAIAPIHNRMPVILEPRDYDRWLDRSPAHQPPTDLLRPLDPQHLRRHPASPEVNNVRNNHADLLKPEPGPPSPPPGSPLNSA